MAFILNSFIFIARASGNVDRRQRGNIHTHSLPVWLVSLTMYLIVNLKDANKFKLDIVPLLVQC